VPVGEHPTKQTQHRSLAPAVRRTPALHRSHAFNEATNDGEEQIGRTDPDEESLQWAHGDFTLIPQDWHRNRLTDGVQLRFHRARIADGFGPDRFDFIGAAVCLVGVAVIMSAPR
jgi:Uncharacterised BCR, YnfA/UPF0060 family